MNHIKKSAADSHSHYDNVVNVTEFNFPDEAVVNDAEISIRGRYPIHGYAINDISIALVSIESGAGFVAIKGPKPKALADGDRLPIKPGEPYAFNALGTLVLRYIAIPAWQPSQSRIIEE